MDLQLGLQVGQKCRMFDRSYELNCIIAINRADHVSQLYALQVGQAGAMKIYGHANGLLEAPAGQVNGKLLIVGFVSLPTSSFFARHNGFRQVVIQDLTCCTN